MRIVAAVVFVAGCFALAGMFTSTRDISIGVVPIVLAIAWIPATVWTRPHWRALRTVVLCAGSGLCVLALFVGTPLLLAVGVLSMLIYGWDLSFAVDWIAPFPKDARRRFAKRYLTVSALLAGGGVGTATVALSRRIVFGFPVALGLAIGCFLLALFLIRLARTSMAERDETDA
jgi:hypothetical protein